MPTTLAHRPGSGAGGVGVNQEDGRTRTPRSTEPSRKRRGAGERGPARIPYLRPERYFGVEPNRWLVEKGIEHELGRDLITIKRDDSTPRWCRTRGRV